MSRLRKADKSMFSTFEIVKDLCEKQGISLNTLEEKLELGKNSLYGLKRNQPSAERLQQIADYFNVSTDYLLGRTDNPTIANKKEQFFFEGKEVDVEELASTAMRFNGKPLTEEDKKAIQNIIEIYLRKQ
ncbi:transcriptional regulator [Streptococcus phage IPP65]|uniref:DNA-binding protein n=4 Tax=root TaxID=1 RepID=A0A1S5SFN2_9CAUD|nr:transcriptional regulator [Streptococcus phage IPP65]YP_010664730.1 transcriptional regulator [Streptococcus phage IPP55]APD23903.1 DNA-binding protein [Streptococcus phage IPP55]APD24371.1 DNA-binding protein [Streptococcus phage IPP65]